MASDKKQKYVRPSHCIGGIGCPEVKIEPDCVRLRLSDRPNKSQTFSYQEWRDLVRAVKAGEYDLPGTKAENP